MSGSNVKKSESLIQVYQKPNEPHKIGSSCMNTHMYAYVK